MENFIKKTLILVLIFSVIIPNFKFAFAQVPTVEENYEPDVNFGDIVEKKIVPKVLELGGTCLFVAVSDQALDFLKDLLGNLMQRFKDKINEFLKNFFDINIVETKVPVLVKNFSEYFSMERMYESFISCAQTWMIRFGAEIINSIGMTTLGWIQGGFEGTPLWITNFGDLLDMAADQALGQLIYEFNPAGLAQILCQGARIEDIEFVLDVYRLPPPGLTRAPRCTLTMVYENIQKFKNSVAEQFDNPYKLLEMRIHDLTYTNDPMIQRSILEARKQTIAAKISFDLLGSSYGGFSSVRVCKEKSPEGICVRYEISHPASVVSEVFNFTFKSELDNLYRKSQDIKTWKDLGELLRLWFNVLSNNAMVEFMRKGFRRNFVPRGSKLTEINEQYIFETLKQATENILNDFASLSKTLAGKFTTLAANFSEINNLTTTINNVLQNPKINKNLKQVSPNNLFDPAKICGITYNANKSKSTAESIIANINKYESSTKDLAAEMKNHYATASSILANYEKDNVTSTRETAEEISKINMLISDAIDKLDRVDSFLSNYYGCKDISITESLDSLKIEVGKKLNNCPLTKTDFIDYAKYVSSTLASFDQALYDNEKALKASYKKLIDLIEKECPQQTQ
jgi:hypothetical protein